MLSWLNKPKILLKVYAKIFTEQLKSILVLKFAVMRHVVISVRQRIVMKDIAEIVFVVLTVCLVKYAALILPLLLVYLVIHLIDFDIKLVIF